MFDGILTFFGEAAGFLVPFAVVVLVGAAREWWVWGYVFRHERAEKEYWRDRALDNLGLAERSVDVAAGIVLESGDHL
jgi:hypothetical protein